MSLRNHKEDAGIEPDLKQSFLQHSRQPESKLTKTAENQSAHEMHGSKRLNSHLEALLRATAPSYLVSPNYPLPTLCWTQLHKPGANSCEGTSRASTASAAPTRGTGRCCSPGQLQIPGAHWAKREGSSTVPSSSN